jgi:hypothetical protein
VRRSFEAIACRFSPTAKVANSYNVAITPTRKHTFKLGIFHCASSAVGTFLASARVLRMPAVWLD